MNANLKLYHATLLEFSTTVALSRHLISSIRKASPPDEDGDSIFVDAYDGHRAYLWVCELPKSPKKRQRVFAIEFNYEAKSGGRLPKSVPRIQELVTILSAIKETMNFDCRVDFKFDKRSKVKLMLVLPMKLPKGLPDAPFDSITGIHLVKLDSKRVKYDVFFDSPGDGTIFEEVLFRYDSVIDDSLAAKVLEEANTISKKFVIG